MKKSALLILVVIVIFMLSALAVIPAAAEPRLAQIYYYTPTAEANGNVYYFVQERDTCVSIALKNNITEETLRTLNNLNVDDCRFLRVGRKLLIAIVPTSTPLIITPTPTFSGPTPTPFNGNGKVCVNLFNDINGNAMPDEGENAIPKGAISLSDTLGKISQTGTTSGDSANPTCFDNIPEGEYNISVAPPEGYNPTTGTNYLLQLKAGDTSLLNFGAQANSHAAASEPAKTGGISPILGIVGILLLGIGIGLALYTRKLLK